MFRKLKIARIINNKTDITILSVVTLLFSIYVAVPPKLSISGMRIVQDKAFGIPFYSSNW